MNKHVFEDAFREAYEQDFLDVLEAKEKDEHEFSSEFLSKMNNVIYGKKKRTVFKSYSRKIAILVIFFSALTITACSFEEIRNPIITYVKEIFEQFQIYFFDGDVTKSIEYEYKITEIPNGYEQVEKLVENNAIITTYKNELGEIIELSQFATENTQYVTNSEQEVYEEILQEITVEFRINGTIKEAVWIHDGYFFNFTYEGKESIDYVKEIIKSIK